MTTISKTKSLEERTDKLRLKWEGANTGGHHSISTLMMDGILADIKNLLSLARKEAIKEVIEDIRNAFLKRGKEQGDKTILWTAKEIVEVMDKILKSS